MFKLFSSKDIDSTKAYHHSRVKYAQTSVESTYFFNIFCRDSEVKPREVFYKPILVNCLWYYSDAKFIVEVV